MYEDDHAPLTLNVTLSEIYHQAASCERTVELAGRRSRVFEQFLPLETYTDIIITGCGSSHHLAICASRAAARDLNPDAPRHLARTVLLNVE